MNLNEIAKKCVQKVRVFWGEKHGTIAKDLKVLMLKT